MVKKLELSQFVNDENFINKMNLAFSDLRADYELTMDTNAEKIGELSALHVDIKNQISDLVSLSRNSSGTIVGLRGTGKTHLLLLARNKLNETLWNEKRGNNLCIYLNLKRLCLPPNYDQDLFNRIFSVYIYEEISNQLMFLLNSLENESLFEKILNCFNREKVALKDGLKKTLQNICEMKIIARRGNENYSGLSVGNYEIESYEKEILSLASKIGLSISRDGANIDLGIDSGYIDELSEKITANNTYVQYLNFQNTRKYLLDIIEVLKINSITFYVDEWEKISYDPNIQKYASFYIDRIMDDPLYFWISIVPYRGNLYSLGNGSDLQHCINLDESLIYESSQNDQTLCVNYFKELVNKRLFHYFEHQDYDYKLLFNTDENFSKLVLASMGNTRDFGTMLLKCWSEYQTYRNSPLSPGRPFKYISAKMIVDSIKDNGDKKYSNIENNPSTVKLWNNMKSFCLEKKSSHFAIEENQENISCLYEQEFSDLIYHRLLHFRKAHVPAKDTSIENKLSIYAINYASTYTLHAQERKIVFITEYKTIHDRVRRYLYNPQEIIRQLKIESGTIFPCINCKMPINTSLMKAAWESNSCPFCGNSIHN